MSIDTRAYLFNIRNVRRGLLTRTRIIQALEQVSQASVSTISQEVGVSYSTTLYHLKNMLKEKIVDRNPETMDWLLIVEQKPLTEFFKPARSRRRRKRSS